MQRQPSRLFPFTFSTSFIRERIACLRYTVELMDVFDRAGRSQVMRAVRSRGNRSTEIVLAKAFRAFGVIGWRTHAALIGRPDFAFRASRVAVFVDGCFWHGCQSCGPLPASNVRYWKTKIARNMSRDKRQAAELRGRGWTVIRLWEHDLRGKKLEGAVRKIQDALQRNNAKLARIVH
jgi:DNA mismatch endonuclease (patch repair protein)